MEKETAKQGYACGVCKTPPLIKYEYITHILGNRHQKNLTDTSQPQSNDAISRTVHVAGFEQKTAVEAVVGAFVDFGVRRVSQHLQSGYIFVEFDSADGIKKVFEKPIYVSGKQLQVSPRHKSPDNPKLKWSLEIMENMLKRRVKGWELDEIIHQFIGEIQLSRQDHDIREFLRKRIVEFLMSEFEVVFGFIFGSSANNLGFKGCDVDLFVDLGVNPWDPRFTKAESQQRARNLTWFLSRMFRSSKRGLKVNAVPNARVPIVKFQDSLTGIMVDLSFKHGMPVCNTRLINQYTRTHPLVRPYLMIIRAWAKIENVAGGGQPSYLLTNYALTMMMLFYLMQRADPIVPSVAKLKHDLGVNYQPVIIDGWDCTFSNNVDRWCNRNHPVRIMELVTEFFTFYKNLDANKWVVSPLAGTLLAKENVDKKLMSNLPKCMTGYCQQDGSLQTFTPLVVQDPFELTHNCTRGLRPGPLAEFQYKCQVAAEVCNRIEKGDSALNDLFVATGISPAIRNELINKGREDNDENKSGETERKVQKNEDSDEIVVVLDTTVETGNMKKSDSSDESVLVLNDCSDNSDDCGKQGSSKDGVGQEVEVIKVGDDADSSVQLISDIKDTGNVSPSDVTACTDSARKYPDIQFSMPENKNFKFYMDFVDIPQFTITVDGAVSGGEGTMTSEDDIGQVVCSLIQFAMQRCLKINISTVEDFTRGNKRSSTGENDKDTGKRIKGQEGNSIPVQSTYHRITRYDCSSENQLWVGRKKAAKRVPQANLTPLQYEVSVTDLLMIEHMALSERLEFTVDVWQKCSDPKRILVTGDSRSSVKITRSQMFPLFTYFSSLCQNLLRKVTKYVSLTSVR